MKRILDWVLFFFFGAIAGCGGSSTLNTNPLSPEDKEKIKQQDKQVEDEERGRPRKR